MKFSSLNKLLNCQSNLGYLAIGIQKMCQYIAVSIFLLRFDLHFSYNFYESFFFNKYRNANKNA